MLPRSQFEYRGSSEEREHLLQHYQRCRGDMTNVFDWVMLSRPELDSHRFRDILEEAIEKGMWVGGGEVWGGE